MPQQTITHKQSAYITYIFTKRAPFEGSSHTKAYLEFSPCKSPSKQFLSTEFKQHCRTRV